MFTRIRTIKGRQYLYQERRWRENGRIRSESKSLGALARLFKIPEDQIGMKVIEQMIETYDIPRMEKERADKEAASRSEAAKAEAVATPTSSPEKGQPASQDSTGAAAGPPSDR